MIAARLRSTLEATGYLVNGEPAAETVLLPQSAPGTRLRLLRPDAWWRSGSVHDFGGGIGASNLTASSRLLMGMASPWRTGSARSGILAAHAALGHLPGRDRPLQRVR